ncbi:Hypothetical protein D9617_7g029440 [Elsinoe fawcettii]|nr:Hypothetical protein D9617_7g029440 [Elsinoe fawcettii]
MSVAEAKAALATRIDQDRSGQGFVLDDVLTDQSVIDICPKILSITYRQPLDQSIIGLGHQSVGQFFENAADRAVDGFGANLMKETLVKTSLNYLLDPFMLYDGLELSQCPPFLQWASRNWLRPCRTLDMERSGPVSALTDRSFVEEPATFRMWLQIFDPDGPHHPLKYLPAVITSRNHSTAFYGRKGSLSHDLSPLYCTALAGLTGPVTRLLHRPEFRQGPCGWYGSPLAAAAAVGATQIVQLLLENGWDPNDETYYGTALCAAASNGRYEVARILVEAGARTRWTSTGKIVVPRWHHEDAVITYGNTRGDLLVNKDAIQECDHEGPSEDTAVITLDTGWLGLPKRSSVCCNLRKGTFRLLFSEEDSASVQGLCSIPGHFFGNATSAATWGGHVALAQFLLRSTESATSSVGCFGSPLQAAAVSARLAMVQYLMRDYEFPKFTHGYYGSALNAALRSSRSVSDQASRTALIDTLATVGNVHRCHNAYHGPALVEALACNDLSSYLLIKDKRPEARDVDFSKRTCRTPLLVAAEQGRPDRIARLLQEGEHDTFCAETTLPTAILSALYGLSLPNASNNATGVAIALLSGLWTKTSRGAISACSVAKHFLPFPDRFNPTLDEYYRIELGRKAVEKYVPRQCTDLTESKLFEIQRLLARTPSIALHKILLFAAEMNCTPLARFCLQHSLEPHNHSGLDTSIALTAALQSGHTQSGITLTRYQVKSGASSDLLSKLLYTLCNARDLYSPPDFAEVFSELTDSGACVHTALHLAMDGGQDSAATLLIDRGAKTYRAISAAVGWNHHRVGRWGVRDTILRTVGPARDSTLSHARHAPDTVLALASTLLHGSSMVAANLLLIGVRINPDPTNLVNLLHHAIAIEVYDAITYLLKHLDMILTVPAMNASPLLAACVYQAWPSISSLMEDNTSVEERTEDGLVPLHLVAALCDDGTVLDLLLSKGADAGQCDSRDNYDPTMLAEESRIETGTAACDKSISSKTEATDSFVSIVVGDRSLPLADMIVSEAIELALGLAYARVKRQCIKPFLFVQHHNYRVR